MFPLFFFNAVGCVIDRYGVSFIALSIDSTEPVNVANDLWLCTIVTGSTLGHFQNMFFLSVMFDVTTSHVFYIFYITQNNFGGFVVDHGWQCRYRR